MAQKYIHYFGNESSESLLEAYGIVTKDQLLSDVLKPKQCPNCNEPNKPDSKFCAKCRMVLTYYAYNETLEGQKQKEYVIILLLTKFVVPSNAPPNATPITNSTNIVFMYIIISLLC